MMSVNKLILGDNLEIMKGMENESVDLIYLDPPFFSNRNYEVIWGDKGEIRSFADRWSGGLEHYIVWLKERVEQMHRLLKPTGSIFLHCDWHANAYIRVEILDKIFGLDNFRGEIIWQRHNAHNDAKKKLAVLSDTIWYYSKSKKTKFNPIFVSFDKESNHYKLEDEKGKYFLGDLTAPNTRKGESGSEWRNINPTEKGRSWAVPNIIVENIAGAAAIKTLTVQEKLDLLYDNGFIVFSKNGIPYVKRYEYMSNGRLIGNLWCDIQNVSVSKERIGYPTQKPEKLLERIISMSSNEGDIVLDPFVGGGTTAVVADRLQRSWIGIDQSVQAIAVTEMRMQKKAAVYSLPFSKQLYKYDYDILRYGDAFEFESFIIQQFGGLTNIRQRNDYGLDGKMPDNTPIQVKRSDNIGRNVIDNFLSAVKRADKKLYEKNIKKQNPVGYIIAFSFSRGAIEEVARLKNKDSIVMKLVTVDSIVPLANKPSISLSFSLKYRDDKGNSLIEFIAVGESASGIEFYAWDFAYDAEKGFNPEVFFDKLGKQEYKFSAGRYDIAVKVYDVDGLECIETIGLTVNGEVYGNKNKD